MWPEVFEPTQVGSFREKVHPPTTEPGDGPFVCVRFNKDWLPYVLGGLFQLVNPSSWLVGDEPSLQQALERATTLLGIFGQAGDCSPMDLRFTDTCLLQSSVDGGTTWETVPGWDTNFPVCNPPQTQVAFTSDCLLTESFDGGETFEAVPGWAANFKDCVISNAPIIGLPPNPGDESKDQFACSIAAYLADQVILLAMQKAVNAIQDDLTLLVFGANVLTIIPEFILVAAAYDAFAAIYGAVAEGTLSHYEDAIASDALWESVTCAIYLAIRSDGYVTPGNFAAILTNVGAIGYAHSDVITAIHNYISSLGATGLAQLSQRAGLLVGSDCSGCGSFCNSWGTLGAGLCNGDWVADPDDPPDAGTCSANQLHSVFGFAGYNRLHWVLTLPGTRTITNLQLNYSGITFQFFSFRLYDHYGGTLLGTVTTNIWSGSVAGVGYIDLNIAQTSQPFTVTQLTVQGHGSSPFPGANC